MKTFNIDAIVLTALIAAATGPVLAQQPPDVVASDTFQNTAMGKDALSNATPQENCGYYNTASGSQSLLANTCGLFNTSTGAQALSSNTTANFNTAAGAQALYLSTGDSNTATGAKALSANTTGYGNTASGDEALFQNTTGNSNIAVGYQAGYTLTTGSNNIDIGSPGATGESNTIRIGTRGTQRVTVIAGIYGVPVYGNAVVVSPTGRLGVTVSSERYKTAIAAIGTESAKLAQLRPVSFHLKSDPKGALQYGLIAEEVAKVYPELVIRNGAGRIDGVRYDELAPMLLNEAQQQQRKADVQAGVIAAQSAQLQELQQQLAALQSVVTKLQAKDELVSQR